MSSKRTTSQISAVKSIPYANSLNYLSNWGNWEIVRELWSNAHDTGTQVKMYEKSNDLYIEDSGPGLNIKDLLIGEHSNKSDGSTIGQFGEGLKMSLLVATRNNVRIDIYSRDLHLWNTSGEIAGIKTLRVDYTEENPIYGGTRVIIQNFGKYLQNFQQNFINGNNDSRIIGKTPRGDILQNPDIYLMGVLIANLPGFKHGYNLPELTINRDRNAINTYEAFRYIGKVYESTTDIAIWRKFWNAIKEKTGEMQVRFYPYDVNQDVIESARQAFESIFGKNLVIGTEMRYVKLAEHLGKRVIMADSLGQSVGIVTRFLEIDVDFVTRKLGQPFNVISSHKIDDTCKANLSYARKIMRRLGHSPKILRIADMMANFAGMYDSAQNLIYLRQDTLRSLDDTIQTVIHEVAHMESGADDLTEIHTVKIQELFGKIVASYMSHDTSINE